MKTKTQIERDWRTIHAMVKEGYIATNDNGQSFYTTKKLNVCQYELDKILDKFGLEGIIMTDTFTFQYKK